MNLKLHSITILMVSALVCTSLSALPVTASPAHETVEQAASHTVRLTVLDDAGVPIPGAVLKIQGESRGRTTNADGIVIMNVPHGKRIVVSFTGMEPFSLEVTRDIDRKVVLRYRSSELDQVVVTGYTTTTKKRTTGSVAVIKSESLKSNPIANTDRLLQGLVAGVDVKAISGRPGEAAKIRIRGTNTLGPDSEPLWVIDGVPLQKEIPNLDFGAIRAGDFNNIYRNGIAGIPPSDIESVTILKDASAAAIYGSQAAGGVIVVTTKRGSAGKLRLNYSANLTLTTAPPRDAHLMNSRQKLAFEQELWDEFAKNRKEAGLRYPVVGIVGAIRAGVGAYQGLSIGQQDAEIARLAQHSTDWFATLFRNAVSHSHTLSAGGGTDAVTYYTSLGYTHESGLVQRTKGDRTFFNLKIDLKPIDRLKIQLSTDLSQLRNNDFASNISPFQYAYFANPYERPYDDHGNYLADQTYHALPSYSGMNSRIPLPPNGFNIMREINGTDSESRNLNATLRGHLSYRITNNLSFDGLASYSYVTNLSETTIGKDTYTAWMDRPFEHNSLQTSQRTYGSNTQAQSLNSSYLLRGQLNYFVGIGTHRISTLVGAEIRSSYGKSVFMKRYGYDPASGKAATPTFPSKESFTPEELKTYSNIVDGLMGQNIIENAFASFFASADYSYKGKYVVSLTARNDGSNSFGQNEQFNPTGSVGAAWNADQEEFMTSLKPYLSTLTMRASTGYTGRVYKGATPYLVMKYLSTFRTVGDNSYLRGRINTPPNDKLRWEKTRDINVALDLGLFDDRIKLLTELYDRFTSDAVTSSPVVSSTGYTSQSYNTSQIRNQGIEFTLSATPIRTQDITLNATTNIAFNRNKLVRYLVPNPNYSSETVEGYPIGAIFTGKLEGVDPYLGLYTYQPRPDASFETADDRLNPNNYLFYVGTKNAPINGGYAISLRYRNFSIGASGAYSLGGLILNEVTPPVDYSNVATFSGDKETIPHYINDLYSYHLNTTQDATHRWTQSNPITTGRPRILDRYGELYYLSDYMVTSHNITKASQLQEISYLKLSSLYASYSIAPKCLKGLGINSLSASLSANNLFVLTNYTGIDPETPGAIYPMPRTYTVGLNIGF